MTNYIIDGYVDKWSYYPGETALIYANCENDNKKYFINVFDYNENVVDKIEFISIKQIINNKNSSEDGFGYKLTFKYYISTKLKSGVYLIDNVIPFIIKNDDREKNKITIVIPTNTINAYNFVNGKNAYKDMITRKFEDRSIINSFLRPTIVKKLSDNCKYIKSKDSIFFYSHYFLQWVLKENIGTLTKNKIDSFICNYICDVDMDIFHNLSTTKLFIIIGHSEYWTIDARKNFDRFVDNGGNAIILSGNTMWWQVRYDSTKTKMICYKELNSDPIIKNNYLCNTINWFAIPHIPSIISSIGLDFNFGGFGKMSSYNFDGLGYTKLVSKKSPLLKDIYVDKLYLPNNEADGCRLIEKNGELLIDNFCNFYKIELIGYDIVYRLGKKYTTFIIFQKTPKSGTIINTGSTNWCSLYGMNKKEFQIITRNMISQLYNYKNIFTNKHIKNINFLSYEFNKIKNPIKIKLDKLPKIQERHSLQLIKNTTYIFQIKGTTKPENLLLNIQFINENNKEIYSEKLTFYDDIIYVKFFNEHDNITLAIKIPFYNDRFSIHIKSIEFNSKPI